MAAYAVMSNHYHVVARIDRDRALAWSTEEVLQRWTQLFTGPLLVGRYLSPARGDMGQAELAMVHEMAETYRARLFDLSWFMRVLNESLAVEGATPSYTFTDPITANRMNRLYTEGGLVTLSYAGSVELEHTLNDPSMIMECPVRSLPSEVETQAATMSVAFPSTGAELETTKTH